MGSDQTESPVGATERTDQIDQAQPKKVKAVQRTPSRPSPAQHGAVRGVDVMALDIIILIAAFFAIAARLNPQPANSLTPVAVLSATGCGLLVTALRKRRTLQRPGLLDAGLSGLIVALFQLIAALSYPTVLNTLSIDEGQRLGFLATWGLIVACSIIFAIAGAALGHLAFTPLRPLPTGSNVSSRPSSVTSSRTFTNYLITILLLGLAPTLVSFAFAAAFDYMLSVYQLTPGPYPTLRLLSTMLPWQIPVHIDFSGSNQSSIILLLWRIPVFVGNPSLFDLQALEPLVFNAAAVSLLLLTMHGRDVSPSRPALPLSWSIYLALAAALGLFLVLPADLWMLGGLHGLLQIPRLHVVVPVRTLRILDSLTFTLNLITGPLVCLAIAALLREWGRRRTKTA